LSFSRARRQLIAPFVGLRLIYVDTVRYVSIQVLQLGCYYRYILLPRSFCRRHRTVGLCLQSPTVQYLRPPAVWIKFLS